MVFVKDDKAIRGKLEDKEGEIKEGEGISEGRWECIIDEGLGGRVTKFSISRISSVAGEWMSLLEKEYKK